VSILVVGLSTRAIAESAVRGGHQIATLDYFGDRDQASLAENLSLMRHFQLPFSAEGLLEASRHLDCQTVVYISNLENHPDVVDGLARGRTLLGNPPPVLRRVRDWRTLRAFCRRSGLPFPTTLLQGEERNADPAVPWLLKPIRSGGGHGIGRWSGEPLDEAHFLQRFVPGQPASAAFVADGRRCVVLGLTEQLIGRHELGAQGFAWCGNILPLSLPARHWAAVLQHVESMANQLAQEFELRGLNGMDLVISDDLGIHLIEVNPRYTASMELMECAYGLNMFSLHLEALAGRLPDWSLSNRMGGPWHGKGIVYARQRVTIPDTDTWLASNRRDIPFEGDQMDAGQPICTVLAKGADRAGCWRQLVDSAESVRQEIGDKVED
jgi:predicted ATP-grasp superfamily ATP-dependent carboligase